LSKNSYPGRKNNAPLEGNKKALIIYSPWEIAIIILLFQSSRRIFLARENLERIFQTGMVACAKKLSLTPDKDKLKAG